jgi:hypothetical protein
MPILHAFMCRSARDKETDEKEQPMNVKEKLRKGAIALAAFLVGGIPPASASTFSRLSLDELVAENSSIVLGQAVESHSYWNDSNTLILTDVRVVVSEVLKGELRDGEVTVTVPGGTVGGEAVALIGSAQLALQGWYVLFLQEGDLPGARGARIVRDHSQGIFEVKMGKGGLRAVSQAVRMALVPDGLGNKEAPGGAEGVPLDDLRRRVRELAARSGRREVKR